MGNYNRTLDGIVTQSDGDAFVVTLAAYSANDCVGGLAKVVTGSGGGMLLRGVSIRDNAVRNEPYIIHIFRSQPVGADPDNPVTIADAAAMALVSADGDLEIGQVTINAVDYVTANGGDYSKAYKEITGIEVREPSDGTFYVYLECTDTPDYVAVDDIKIEFWYWMD